MGVETVTQQSILQLPGCVLGEPQYLGGQGVISQAVPQFPHPPDYPQGCLPDDLHVESVPALELQVDSVPSPDDQVVNIPVQLIAEHVHGKGDPGHSVESQPSLHRSQPQDEDLHQTAGMGQSALSKTQVNEKYPVIEKRRVILKASRVLCMWKKTLAKHLLLYSLDTLAGASSVNISTTTKCLNDSNRAKAQKLVVASSVLPFAGDSVIISVSVFPAWPPEMYELSVVLKRFCIITGNTSSLLQ